MTKRRLLFGIVLSLCALLLFLHSFGEKHTPPTDPEIFASATDPDPEPLELDHEVRDDHGDQDQEQVEEHDVDLEDYDGDKARVIKSLQSLAKAQERFVKEDLDKDGVADFATLEELRELDLVEGPLATGNRIGDYEIEMGVTVTRDGETQWMGTATQVEHRACEHFSITRKGVKSRHEVPYVVQPKPELRP